MLPILSDNLVYRIFQSLILWHEHDLKEMFTLLPVEYRETGANETELSLGLDVSEKAKIYTQSS